MIRSIQNYPGAEQTGRNGQAVRKDRKGADFGSMLQRQIQESQAARPESGFEDRAARAAAEAGQAAAIRQAMGLATGPDAGTAAGICASAVPGMGAAGTVSGSAAVSSGAAGTVSGSAAVSSGAAGTISGSAAVSSGAAGTISGSAAGTVSGSAAGTVSGSAAGTAAVSGGAAARQTVNFSKHALARAEQRGIELTDTLLDRLADSVERAQAKGAKNILAFDNTRAFIINIPYSRVITAISQEEMRENIFTNIDGAVLL